MTRTIQQTQHHKGAHKPHTKPRDITRHRTKQQLDDDVFLRIIIEGEGALGGEGRKDKGGGQGHPSLQKQRTSTHTHDFLSGLFLLSQRILGQYENHPPFFLLFPTTV